MPVKCHFNLSRSSAVYYAGEQISGTLMLTIIKKPLNVEGIHITLLGISTTSWHETDKCLPQIEHNDSTGPAEPPQLYFGATKTHIEQTQELAKSLILPPGSLQLGSFTFQLPNEVPGSCRLPHGSISYSLQLTLERRSKQAKRFQHRLVVRNRIEFLEPRPATTESSTLCLSLPRSVFVPGQRVAYQLETSTSSSQLLTRLCQCIRYESHQPVAKFKKVVRILDESSSLEDALHLPLTALIMSQRSGDLIEITYYVETLGSCSEPLRLPLFVGTVAPPVDTHISLSSLGFVNFALSENEVLLSSINQLLPHSYSRELVPSSSGKYNEQLKLLRRQKKQSYVRIALRYFYKRLLPAN
ncbi:uncharacterized protein LOC133836368 [Drosophila sulfurigaster albostrigata]|uniref:uncharacterized protein LOC133836368 n=1 Tax=Drosophila sulfurigaster albostrigata TaxID=89887 RepID=UPI002D21C76E|nr:uncharacterized protein LOC133836368 [Drosophila sulfurigaster albostrigata]